MNNTAQAVLVALFDMAKNDRAATVIRLMDQTGLDRIAVLTALSLLDHSGLADASRVRLSMFGLAAASQIAAVRPASKVRRLRAA